MPRRNAKKAYRADTHYHIFNQGIAGEKIFLDHQDFVMFLGLLQRHLGQGPVSDNSGRELLWLGKRLDLEAYCLMGNHFQLLIYQHDADAMPLLMKALTGAYTRYFNAKYKSSGPLFQGVYKAVAIADPNMVTHVSRYIHLDPIDHLHYPYSSLPYYLGEQSAEWLKPQQVLSKFDSLQAYAAFVADRDQQDRLLNDLTPFLADH